jgi:hypothetical protein
MLSLRAKYPVLQTGEMRILAADKDILAYTRVLPDAAETKVNPGRKDKSAEKIIVVVNRASAAATLAIKLVGTALAGSSQFHTLIGEATAQWSDGNARIEVPPVSVWIAEFR